MQWEGEGVNEQGIVVEVSGDSAPEVEVGQVLVQVDPCYFRPTEVETLRGDPTKAKEKLGWVPRITYKKWFQRWWRVT